MTEHFVVQKNTRRFFSLMMAIVLALCFCQRVFAEQNGGSITLDGTNTSFDAEFGVENMFPGDSIAKSYTISVKHSAAVTVHYRADLRDKDEYKKLAEVLKIKIELPDKEATPLYDGLIGAMPESLEYQLAAGEKSLLYRITAYLDSSVGNEYQNLKLIADFRWWYLTESDGGGGAATGDDFAPLAFIGLFAVSAAVLVVLSAKRRREGVMR